MKIKQLFKKLVPYIAGTALALMLVPMLPKSEYFLRNQVVMLMGEEGLCSGEQVEAPSGKTYVLTAAHCKGLEDDRHQILVLTADGRTLPRQIVAEDPHSDLLLLEGVPSLPGLKVSKDLDIGEHVRTFTHGAGHATHRTEGEILETVRISIPLKFGTPTEEMTDCNMPKNELAVIPTIFGPLKICFLNVPETFMTAHIVPGSSGGPVVNDHGDLVGVVSAGDGTFGAIVTLRDIHRFIKNY